MGSREVYNELARLAQNPKITAEKGLLRTLNNSALGFVSDLHNMEINDNGVVVRRKGTRLISKSTEQHRWYFLEESVINSVNFLFGLDYRRRLYCWLKYWPELNIRVFSKLITNDFIINTGAGESSTRQVSFSRGSKFWFTNFEDHIDIVNNFGDIYRIMKNGIIRITKNVYAPQDEHIKDDLNEVRTGASEDVVCYMDVKDVSQREIPDGLVNFIDTDNSDYEEIIGDIEVARVNDAGKLSKLSKPYGINTYRKGFVSMVDGMTINADTALELDFIARSFYGKTSDQDGFLISRNTDGSYDVDESLLLVSNNMGLKRVEILLFYDNPHKNYFYNGDEQFNASSVNNKMYMFLPYGSAGDISDKLSSSSIGRFISIVDVRGMNYDLDDVPIGNIDAYIVDKHEGKFQMPTILDADIASSDDEITCTYSRSDYIDDYMKGTYYELNVTADYIDDLDLATNYIFDDEDGFTTTEFKAVLSGNLLYNADASSGNEWVAQQVYYWYKGGQLDKTSVAIRNLGFDTWSVVDYDTTPVGSSSNFIDNVDTITKEVKISIEYDSNPDVYLAKDQFVDFINNGFRFAVVQGDRILAVSQRGLSITQSDEKDFIYKIEASREAGEENEANAPSGQFYKIFSPICALEHLGIRTSGYKRKDIVDVVRDPKHIKVNNNVVFVVQGNQLWTCKSDDWLLDDVIEVSMGINQIETFHAGIMLATEKGLYYFEAGKTLRKVINGDNIISQNIQKNRGGVVVFSEDGSVYMCRMNITASGAEYPVVVKISTVISEEIFNPKASIVSVDDTIYISSEYEIWGFSVSGNTGRWDKKYSFDMPINKLAKFDNRLVIAFNQQFDKESIYTPPSGISVIGDL
jgi:hypothetical protein